MIKIIKFLMILSLFITPVKINSLFKLNNTNAAIIINTLNANENKDQNSKNSKDNTSTGIVKLIINVIKEFYNMFIEYVLKLIEALKEKLNSNELPM